MLEICNTVVSRESRQRTTWESMKRNKPKEKKQTKRDKVSILEGSAVYSPGHIPPLKAALAPSGIVAWKTMPDSG